MCWFELQFPTSAQPLVTNHPSHPQRQWSQAIHWLPRPFKSSPHATLPIRCSRTDTMCWFDIASPTSKLPPSLQPLSLPAPPPSVALEDPYDEKREQKRAQQRDQIRKDTKGDLTTELQLQLEEKGTLVPFTWEKYQWMTPQHRWWPLSHSHTVRVVTQSIRESVSTMRRKRVSYSEES